MPEKSNDQAFSSQKYGDSMIEDEVILVNKIPASDYNSLVENAIRYALISKPFTIRRIGNQTLEQAILNIFKGKLAEGIFRYFCVSNNLNMDWDSCSTPFWQIDNRDFIWQETEWDLKNNFIYHPGKILNPIYYTNLPALVPNRRPGDQWDDRVLIKNPALAKSAGFVFSFMKGSSISAGKRDKDFYELVMTPEQLELLQRAEQKYEGLPPASKPFEEDVFWREMEKRGNLELIKIHERPFLIITCYANQTHFPLFKNTGPGDHENNFVDAVKGGWYEKSGKGSVNFLNNTLWATITNATCPVKLLPTFLSLFPNLRDNIVMGEIKSMTHNGDR